MIGIPSCIINIRITCGAQYSKTTYFTSLRANIAPSKPPPSIRNKIVEVEKDPFGDGLDDDRLGESLTMEVHDRQEP